MLETATSALRRWLAQRVRRWGSFIETYVFPDGELVTPADMLAPASTAGFEVRDVESLREHYAYTLRHLGPAVGDAAQRGAGVGGRADVPCVAGVLWLAAHTHSTRAGSA